MAKIRIKILDDSEEYEPYQFLGAVISLNDKEFVLDSVCLNTENDEEDLELLEGFGAQWEIIAKQEKLDFDVGKEIDDLQYQLEQNIEDNEVDEENTMERCQD